MSDASPTLAEGPASSPKPHATGPIGRALRSIRARIVSGLLVSLPIAITIWVFYWLYTTLRQFLLDPAASLIRSLLGPEVVARLPPWWERFVAPFLAAALVLLILYFLGYFARTRMYRAIDWILQRVPIVTTVYKAVRNLFQSLENQGQGMGYQRVVLVAFPHPGSRALAFVTKSLRDSRTGKTILCVCVLTGVVPPAGFTLFVPEEDVVDIDWSVNQTLQAILSGGITAPNTIPFHASPRPGAGEPLFDASGHPIASPPA